MCVRVSVFVCTCECECVCWYCIDHPSQCTMYSGLTQGHSNSKHWHNVKMTASSNSSDAPSNNSYGRH